MNPKKRWVCGLVMVIALGSGGVDAHDPDRHGDNATNLGGAAVPSDRNGVLQLRAEYGAVGRPEVATAEWIDDWGFVAQRYGATPEDYYKDEVALNEAIRDWDPGLHGRNKRIFLEDGEYWFKNDVVVRNDGVTIYGNGSDRVKFRSETTEPPIQITTRKGTNSYHHLTLRGMDLGWSYINATLSNHLRFIDLHIGLPGGPKLNSPGAIVLRGCSDCVIDGCIVENTSNDGIFLRERNVDGNPVPCRRTVVIDSETRDCGSLAADNASLGDGIAIGSAAFDCAVINCEVDTATDKGIHFEGNNISNCYAIDSNVRNVVNKDLGSFVSGFYTENCTYVSIWGGNYEGNGTRAVSLGSSSRQVTAADLTIVLGDAIQYEGVVAATSDYTSVSNCAVYVATGATNTSGVGIRMQGADSNVVRANTITGAGENGIKIFNCDGSFVVDNTIADCGNDPGVDNNPAPAGCGLRSESEAIIVTGNVFDGNVPEHFYVFPGVDFFELSGNFFSAPATGLWTYPYAP
jgi:parallel beta-helix repeat protein